MKTARARPHVVAAFVLVDHPPTPVCLRVLTGRVELECWMLLSELIHHWLGRTRLAERVQVLLCFHIVREALVPFLELFTGCWCM